MPIDKVEMIEILADTITDVSGNHTPPDRIAERLKELADRWYPEGEGEESPPKDHRILSLPGWAKFDGKPYWADYEIGTGNIALYPHPDGLCYHSAPRSKLSPANPPRPKVGSLWEHKETGVRLRVARVVSNGIIYLGFNSRDFAGTTPAERRITPTTLWELWHPIGDVWQETDWCDTIPNST